MYSGLTLGALVGNVERDGVGISGFVAAARGWGSLGIFFVWADRLAVGGPFVNLDGESSCYLWYGRGALDRPFSGNIRKALASLVGLFSIHVVANDCRVVLVRFMRPAGTGWNMAGGRIGPTGVCSLSQWNVVFRAMGSRYPTGRTAGAPVGREPLVRLVSCNLPTVKRFDNHQLDSMLVIFLVGLWIGFGDRRGTSTDSDRAAFSVTSRGEHQPGCLDKPGADGTGDGGVWFDSVAVARYEETPRIANGVPMSQPSNARASTDAKATPVLELQELTCAYGSKTLFRGVSARLYQGETLAVLGESGCGKTTLLKVIAGTVPQLSGQVYLAGRRIEDWGIQERRVISLDQEALLFHHLNVAGNVGFSLRVQGVASVETHRQVHEMLQAVDLRDYAGHKPTQLSGGQKQRVAFARAILAQPRVLLLDEPFASLDAQTRAQMQRLFRSLQRSHQLTSLFVTHDVKEALLVGDRFARLANSIVTFYADRTAFLNDPLTGVQSEVEFWRETSQHLNPPPSGQQ